MFQHHHLARSQSFGGSLKALEADVQHANSLADAVRRVYGGACIQMRLTYSPLAPIFLFLLQWFDCSCSYSLPGYMGLLNILVFKVYSDGDTTIETYARRASFKEFYAVIYPSLQQIESNMLDDGDTKERFRGANFISRKRSEDWRRALDADAERDDECGICFEACTKMVLPSCNHAMCIHCYRDWNTRSQSCPFCRGSLKRVRSRDLWVLTNHGDVVDLVTLEKENVKCFYQYIDSLPLIIPDSLFPVHYDYLL